MPESEIEHIDYYPSGWTEEVYEPEYVEWIFDDDPDIFVRLDGTSGTEEYAVSAITGINRRGEEFVTRTVSNLSAEPAHDVAIGFVYAMNGTAGRLAGEPEFTGGAES